jgi:histidyl-tRNA synthetase
VYVAPVSESVQPTAVGIANDIRAEGKTVDIDLSGRSIGSQFSYADTINAAFTIVVGERDLEDGEVTIQDMASGEEENVPLEDVTEELLARHGE